MFKRNNVWEYGEGCCRHVFLVYLFIIITLAGIVMYFAGYNEQIHFSPLNLELFTSAGHCFKLALLGK